MTDKCKICGLGEGKRPPTGMYYQLHETMNGDFICDGECDMIMLLQLEKKYCEVGEHYVKEEDMWADFADCKNCVSEKDYINTRENV